MQKEWNELSSKEKHIFVWIEYIYLLFIECKQYRGYLNFINNYIVPFKIKVGEGKYRDVFDDIPEVLMILKDLLGHHYHMWLFIELREMIKEIIA